MASPLFRGCDARLAGTPDTTVPPPPARRYTSSTTGVCQVSGRTLSGLPCDPVLHYLQPVLSNRELEACRKDDQSRGPVTTPYALDPLKLQRHLAPGCDAALFSGDRFATTIAPWFEQCDPAGFRALENWRNHETFPWLVCAATGSQLLGASRLELQESVCFWSSRGAGAVVSVVKGRYELCEAPPLQEENVSMSPDLERFFLFVGDADRSVTIHDRQPDGSWARTAEIDHGQLVRFAQWSPCSRYLAFHTETENPGDVIRVWSRGNHGLWQEDFSKAGRFYVKSVGFSPDSRVFCLQASKEGDSVAYSWWRGDDGRWTAGPGRFVSEDYVEQMAFSRDGRTLAVQCSATDVAIWRQTATPDWQEEGRLPLDGPDRDSRHLREQYQSAECRDLEGMAFSIYGQLAIVRKLNPHESLYDKDWHLCLTLWAPGRQGWHKQAQLVLPGDRCLCGSSNFCWDGCGSLKSLYFSQDGRCLIARAGCDGVRAWCLVPDRSASDSLVEADADNLS